jgi:hypothetical protein
MSPSFPTMGANFETLETRRRETPGDICPTVHAMFGKPIEVPT